MSTVLTPANLAAEERFLLRHVLWATYEQLLENYAEHSAPRFTYNEGVLEIMSPSHRHETLSRILEALITAICDARGIDVHSAGSTTYRRDDLRKGVEPDGCFYFDNAERMRGVDEIDLNLHPVPDLVIEVDISNPSLDRFPIYAALGVPEIWRYADEHVRFWRLNTERNEYAEIKMSDGLPRVTAEAVTQFITDSRTLKRPAWLERVRAWLATN